MMESLAIGVGCRRGCPADAIVTLVIAACEGLDRAGAGLFTIDIKQAEAGLRGAAEVLGLPLRFLPAATLEAALPGVTLRSARVSQAVGVPSVAEAAALAGAGTGATLIVPRRARNGATCAVARLMRPDRP